MKARLEYAIEGRSYFREVQIAGITAEIRIPFSTKYHQVGDRFWLDHYPPEFPETILRFSHMDGETAVYRQDPPQVPL